MYTYTLYNKYVEKFTYNVANNTNLYLNNNDYPDFYFTTLV